MSELEMLTLLQLIFSATRCSEPLNRALTFILHAQQVIDAKCMHVSDPDCRETRFDVQKSLGDVNLKDMWDEADRWEKALAKYKKQVDRFAWPYYLDVFWGLCYETRYAAQLLLHQGY